MVRMARASVSSVTYWTGTSGCQSHGATCRPSFQIVIPPERVPFLPRCHSLTAASKPERKLDMVMKIQTTLQVVPVFIATALNSFGQPAFITQPTNQVAYVGETATFSFEFTADGPRFQWRFNGAD